MEVVGMVLCIVLELDDLELEERYQWSQMSQETERSSRILKDGS